MIVNREELLMRLESIQAGLSKREILEQSSCFVFYNGEVYTYNEEVCCRTDSPLKIEGAIQAAPLLEMLRKLPEQDLDFEVVDSELVIKGKKRRCGITLQKDILLPIHQVDVPEKWRKLHPEFTEAVQLVRQSASDNAELFLLSCVHLTPDYIEACNNVRLTRYEIPMKLKRPTLVKGSHLIQVCPLGVVKFGETESWIHFQDPNGLIISMRRYQEEYLDLSSMIPKKGNPVNLPKGLPDAVEKATVFTSENLESNDILIRLKPGQLLVLGQGISGWYKELKSINYSGPEISFTVAPKLLSDLSSRHSECEISRDKLVVRGEKFIYVTALGIPTTNG